jgi:hypothetical protein
LSWSPLYGKVALWGAVLHFDALLEGGGGVVRTEEEASLELEAATRPDFYLGCGLRVFVGGRWLVRLGLRQHLYLRPEDQSGRGGGLGLPTEASVGFGVLLGGAR